MTLPHHNDWNGSERRSIPIHILNHIDERLEVHAAKVEEQFEALRAQITSLTLSITSWMEKEPESIAVKCEKLIDEALPVHPSNQQATPSEKRHEHRKAHADWINKVDEEVKRWTRIREDVTKWVIAGTLSGVVAWVVWSINNYLALHK